ncbi:MAG: hypothetical protein RIR18_234, partial [Pseudomonadota bacterium]
MLPEQAPAKSRSSRSSLIGQLEKILSSALFLAALFTLAFIITEEVFNRKKELINQSDAWLRALAVQLEPSLMFKDAKAAEELLQATSQMPALVGSLVTVESIGDVFATESIASYTSPNHESLDAKPLSKQQTNKTSVFSAYWIRSTEIYVAGAPIGMLYAKIDTGPMWNDIFRFALIIVLILSGSGLLATKIARREFRKAFEPILELTRITAEVTH